MTKICMIVHSYYLRDGRVRREAETLADAGCQVDVICLQDSGEARTQTHNGVRIRRLPITRRRGSKLRYIFEYASFLALSGVVASALQLRNHYHIVHIHTLPDFLVFAGLLPRLMGAKIVLDVHDLMPESFLSKSMGEGQSSWLRVLQWVERRCFQFPDHIITIHEPYADLIAQRGGTRSRITSLMNLADNKIFNCNGQERTGNGHHDGFVMLYAGTVARRYGLETALRAVPLLTPAIPGFRFVVLGEGEHKAEFQEMAEQMGISPHVYFHPPVPIDQVPDVMRQADVGISPHVDDLNYRWSFPQKVYEYICMGLPVVTSPTDVVRYYYGDAVFYARSGDAQDLANSILEIYEHPELVQQKASLAEKFLDAYQWSNERRKLLNLVQQLS